MPHYYDQPHMKMIKHGFTHEHDKPESFPECPFTLFLGSYEKHITVTEISMENEKVLIKTYDGELRVLPGQLSYEEDEGQTFGWLTEISKYVSRHAHAIPAMFQHMLDDYKSLNFHPGKTPKTIELLRDISVHLLRPMEADCPNERMQEAVKEILWHVNNHMRKGDLVAIRHIETNKLSLGEVVYFNKNLQVLRWENLHNRHLEDTHFGDTHWRIERYFGVERWAFKTKDEALIAAKKYYDEHQLTVFENHVNF